LSGSSPGPRASRRAISAAGNAGGKGGSKGIPLELADYWDRITLGVCSVSSTIEAISTNCLNVLIAFKQSSLVE
jgi:hypothetical protein